MRQRTTLTSMTQFALQVVPREDEDERQKEQPHELLKKKHADINAMLREVAQLFGGHLQGVP